MNTASNVLENDLHTVTQQLDELIALESFSGAAATNAKKYFETFHKTAIESIQLMAQQLSANIHAHIDTFKVDVDSHESARIDYNYLQEVKKNVQTVHDNIEESVGHITDTLEDISDIVAIDPPSMIELETEKNNMVKSIDVLTKNVELFTEKGADHDDEMKEMIHHLETMINEASSSTGESRFTTIESTNTINSLAFLGEANQLLGERQWEQQLKQEMVEFNENSQNTFAEAQTLFETNIHYEPQQNPIAAFGDVLLDVIIGGSKGAYHFAEDFVLGIVEMIEDPVAALEALATMVFNPIDTGYYLGKMTFESFFRDVIHGDAESRAHWFTYALSTVLGPKAVKQVGKKVDSKAKAGAQKAEQQLDDLLPYHPKHQVALVGPVPYNVLNGGFFVDRLVMMSEKVSGGLTGSRNVGKGTGEIGWNMSKGGGEINGRKYSQHALERMAPDLPEVKATLTSRAIKKAEELGYKPQTKEFSDFIKNYVEPRNIPPSVIEDAIMNTTKIPGYRSGTFVHETQDVKVIINEAGDVITVIPK